MYLWIYKHRIVALRQADTIGPYQQHIRGGYGSNLLIHLILCGSRIVYLLAYNGHIVTLTYRNIGRVSYIEVTVGTYIGRVGTGLYAGGGSSRLSPAIRTSYGLRVYNSHLPLILHVCTLNDTSSHTSKGYDSCSCLGLKVLASLIEGYSIIGFRCSEGGALLQIGITIAARRVAQYEEYLIGTSCHEVGTCILGTQHDDIQSTITPVHRGTVLAIVHGDVEGALCCGKLGIGHHKLELRIALFVYLNILYCAIRQVAGSKR